MPGTMCQPESRNSSSIRDAHILTVPQQDDELTAVVRWLSEETTPFAFRRAVEDSIRYVLDGARTWRFDLMSPEVDSDERASVGTKFQYHLLEQLELRKSGPLDTHILGIPVEIKATIGKSWMIPIEGQCEVTLLVQIDARNYQFRVFAMRTHRVWLTGGVGNGDRKRSPLANAIQNYAIPLYPWQAFDRDPLQTLDETQKAEVFDQSIGMTKRTVAMFASLPETVIPRTSLLTVGAGLADPMKRVRESKPLALSQHDLVVLVGTWTNERLIALDLGFDLSNEEWVAIPKSRLLNRGYSMNEVEELAVPKRE